MKLKLYSLRDAKAQIFGTPIAILNDALAERHLHRLTNDPQSGVNHYPKDYDLYELGSFDDQTGKLDLLDSPAHKFKAIDYFAKEIQH